MLTDFIGVLEGLTMSPWFLPVVFVVALADAVVPVVPSETAVIVGGVAAGFGEIGLWSVVLAAAPGTTASRAGLGTTGSTVSSRWACSGSKT